MGSNTLATVTALTPTLGWLHKMTARPVKHVPSMPCPRPSATLTHPKIRVCAVI